jgi:hypothetical protein
MLLQSGFYLQFLGRFLVVTASIAFGFSNGALRFVEY